MSEIAIISTREVIYEPSMQKQGKIKVTLKLLQGYGVWNLDVKYFGVSPKVGTREVQVQVGTNEETNEPIYETQTEMYDYEQIDFIKEKTLIKTDAEMKQLFTLVNKTIAPNEFPEKFYEIQRDSLLIYVQNDTLINGDCIFGIKQNEWVICENN